MKPLNATTAVNSAKGDSISISWTWRWQLLCVFLLTLLVRLVFAYLVLPALAPQTDLMGDDGYDRIGLSLAQGFGYVVIPGGPPTMKRVPLYPLFLAGIFKFLGTDIRIIQWLQAGFDGFTALAISFITSKLFSRRAALVAGGLFAFYPLSILYSSRFYTESLYTLLLCSFAYVLLSVTEGRGRQHAVLAGLLLGCLVLTRSVTLLLPLFLLPFLILSQRSPAVRRQRLQDSAIILLMMGLILAPWVVRNYHLTGKILLGGTTLGAPLYHGYYVSQHWRWGKDMAKLHRRAFDERQALVAPTAPKILSLQDEMEANRLALQAVAEKMWQHPAATAWMLLRNLLLVWFLTRSPTMMLLIGAVHFSLLLLASRAVWQAWRRSNEKLILMAAVIGVIACFVVVHALVFPFARYLAPVMPLVIVFASASLVENFPRAINTPAV
ncbi:MAG: glycosyltransferase family 39 protein [Acidobacteria bacterium]|nr:glycosyltransferase family 39 protein [Acidobacteriota bacterium]